MALFLRLRELRGDRPQKDVARSLGMTQPTYARYEKGDREPDLETLKTIAIYFGVTSDWLLGLTDVKVGNPRAEEAERKLIGLKNAIKELVNEY